MAPSLNLGKVKYGGITSILCLIVWITRVWKKLHFFLFSIRLLWMPKHFQPDLTPQLADTFWNKMVFQIFQCQTPNNFSSRCIIDTCKSHPVSLRTDTEKLKRQPGLLCISSNNSWPPLVNYSPFRKTRQTQNSCSHFLQSPKIFFNTF